MDSRDRMAIEGLFAKLASVEQAGQPRDAEAEAFIHHRIAAQPGAPYYLAQTVLVQEQALDAAQQRIAELECLLAERAMHRGRLGGGKVDNGPWSPPLRHHVPLTAPLGGDPRPMPTADGGGPGGFLAGAAQTAMGVAGGVLLANMISGLFGRDAAHGSDVAGGDRAMNWGDDPSLIEPAGNDDDGYDFFGGDFEI